MVARPKIPTNLPILNAHFPCSGRVSRHDYRDSRELIFQTLWSQNTPYQWLHDPTVFFVDLKTFSYQMPRFPQLGAAIVMNRGQRFAFFYAIADALVKFQADSVVDVIFLGLPSSAEHRQCDAKLFAVGAGHKTARCTGQHH